MPRSYPGIVAKYTFVTTRAPAHKMNNDVIDLDANDTGIEPIAKSVFGIAVVADLHACCL